MQSEFRLFISDTPGDSGWILPNPRHTYPNTGTTNSDVFKQKRRYPNQEYFDPIFETIVGGYNDEVFLPVHIRSAVTKDLNIEDPNYNNEIKIRLINYFDRFLQQSDQFVRIADNVVKESQFPTRSDFASMNIHPAIINYLSRFIDHLTTSHEFVQFVDENGQNTFTRFITNIVNNVALEIISNGSKLKQKAQEILQNQQ